MSGHSKWSKIKHTKGAVDAKRGRIFTKLIRELTIAARMGGGDPGGNPRLRSAIAAARQENMPNDNIQRAIKKGTGELDDGTQIEEFTYEGYGPGGVAIMVEVTTDNRNRTTADIRQTFTKLNGNLGASGCVAWMFKQRGVITFSAKQYSEEQLMEAALEVGAEDVVPDGDDLVVYTKPNDYVDVKEALDQRGLKYSSAELTRVPENTIKVAGRDAETLLKLVEKLDELDDVAHVYANFDIDEKELEALANA